MNANETLTGAARKKADEDAVCEHLLTGEPLDPDVRRRVQARAEKITEEVRRVHGDVDVDRLLLDAREEV
ncbi:MAG TPA: hypothetical protein VGY66_35870 [Gemmataceae bacterium]|nr:hypothetical protein [Gemmataceae bacterium]